MNKSPTTLPPARHGRLLLLALIAAALPALWLLYWFDPATAGFFPPCMLHQTTGLHCPGCGGTRAVHALLHGRLLAALSHNALLLLLLPVLALVFARWALNLLRRRPHVPATARLSARVIAAIAAGVIAFAVIRNLPVFPCTLLAP